MLLERLTAHVGWDMQQMLEEGYCHSCTAVLICSVGFCAAP